MHAKTSTVAAAAAAVISFAGAASAQQYVNGVEYPGTNWTAVGDPSTVPSQNASAEVHTRNLTPDGFYHAKYHMELSMAAYGNYNTLCPIQTFTNASMLKNFPDSNRTAWTVINTFGPTASGAQGFTAIVPEMNKALIVFQGNYQLEQSLSDEVVGWDYLGLEEHCRHCTVNKFAAQGYLEARNETNNWADILGAYYNTALVFSITGHGLGGMHSQIASMDLNQQGTCWYSHAYGSPRVFNQEGADLYNSLFNGEAGERGVAGNDTYTEFIPAGPNYAHAGTTFYYYGLNATNGSPNYHICWDDSEDPECKPGAQPQPWNTTSEEDHYFYATTVGECGGRVKPNTTIIADYIQSNGLFLEIDSEYATPSSTRMSTSSNYYGQKYPATTNNYYYPTSSSTNYYGAQSTSRSRGGYGTSSSSRNYGYPPAGPAGPAAGPATTYY